MPRRLYGRAVPKITEETEYFRRLAEAEEEEEQDIMAQIQELAEAQAEAQAIAQAEAIAQAQAQFEEQAIDRYFGEFMTRYGGAEIAGSATAYNEFLQVLNHFGLTELEASLLPDYQRQNLLDMYF